MLAPRLKWQLTTDIIRGTQESEEGNRMGIVWVQFIPRSKNKSSGV